MHSQPVTVARRGSVAVVTVDDGAENILDAQVVGSLQAAFRSLLLDDVGAVVLAGRPGYYCAGLKLDTLMSLEESANILMHAGTELVLSIVEFPRPIVAACTGHAAREGAIALLGCDVRIGRAANYTISMDWVAHGVPAPDLGIELARSRLSPRHVTLACNTARIYSPDEAIEAGFLDSLSTGDVVEEACAVAADLAARIDPVAFEITRTTTCRGLSESIIRTAGDLWRARRIAEEAGGGGASADRLAP